MKPFPCGAALLAVVLAGPATAQVALNPPAARLSDTAIHADQQAFAATQAEIKALNDRGLGVGPRVSDYHLSKAQCWLDVSFHEYTRNDRSAFPQLALEQSQQLIAALAAQPQTLSLPQDTPLINDADRLREDLWAAAQRLKSHPGFRCAAARTACAEVELVHAGNEHRQYGWRHAKPYLQIAEDLLLGAEAAAAQCPAPASARPPPVAAAPAPTAPPPVQTLSFGAEALFPFGKGDTASIKPAGRQAIEDGVARLLQQGFKPQQVQVLGHSDRINDSGRKDFNQQLSLQRAQAVAAVLAAAGIDASIISAEGRGDAEPLVACEGAFASRAALKDCLAPNRRVELRLNGLSAR